MNEQIEVLHVPRPILACSIGLAMLRQTSARTRLISPPVPSKFRARGV